MIKVNGKEVSLTHKNLEEFLISQGYNTSRIAVELNGNIVTKEARKDTCLKPGDSMEVVSFVGGG